MRLDVHVTEKNDVVIIYNNQAYILNQDQAGDMPQLIHRLIGDAPKPAPQLFDDGTRDNVVPLKGVTAEILEIIAVCEAPFTMDSVHNMSQRLGSSHARNTISSALTYLARLGTIKCVGGSGTKSSLYRYRLVDKSQQTA